MHAVTRKSCSPKFEKKKKNAFLVNSLTSYIWKEGRFVTLSDWEDYQKPTNWSQHPEPTLVSPQSEIVSLCLLFDTKALILILAAKTLRWEWGEQSDTVEAVIGQVSGEDAKSSGQRATERGAAVTSCWLSQDRWDNQQPKARTVLQPCLQLVFEGNFSQHLTSELTFHSLQYKVSPVFGNLLEFLRFENIYDVVCW